MLYISGCISVPQVRRCCQLKVLLYSNDGHWYLYSPFVLRLWCQKQLSHCHHNRKVSPWHWTSLSGSLALVLIWWYYSVSSASKPSRKLLKRGIIKSSEQFGLAIKLCSTVIFKIPNQGSLSPKRLIRCRNYTYYLHSGNYFAYDCLRVFLWFYFGGFF